jgi:hypothetical protein
LGCWFVKVSSPMPMAIKAVVRERKEIKEEED